LDTICATENYVKIPFKIIRIIPVINTEIMFIKNDEICNIEGGFMIDYGHYGSIGIKAATSKSQPLICKQSNSHILNNIQDTVDIQFSDIIFKNTPIHKSNIKHEDSTGVTGVIGVQFLARFDVILDYNNKYIYLKSLDE
jgi:hypothetical protein